MIGVVEIEVNQVFMGIRQLAAANSAEISLIVWMRSSEVLANIVEFVVNEVTFEALVNDFITDGHIMLVGGVTFEIIFRHVE